MLIRSLVMMAAAAASVGLIASHGDLADRAGSGGQTQRDPCDASEGSFASAPCAERYRSTLAGPISSRQLKEDITYVSPAALEELSDAALGIRLATFRYKGGDGSTHLGFIIEDSPKTPASDLKHGRVDLYGYASMAVAALQVQARHLEQIEREIDVLSNELDALRTKPLGPFSSTCEEHPALAPLASYVIESSYP